MMDELEGSKQTGRFTVSPITEVYGELTLAGAKTSLYLHDKEFFNTHAIPGQCVKGVLHDLAKVSLIQGITTSGTGSGRRGDESYHFANIFSHFVAYGDHHIDPNEKTIIDVDDLARHGLVEQGEGGRFHLTALGRLAGQSAVEVETLIRAVGCLRSLRAEELTDPALIAISQTS